VPVIGTQQSPVRIVKDDTYRVDFGKDFLTFAYAGPLPGVFKGDNFDFDVTSSPGGGEVTKGKELTAGGTLWVLRKIHLHSPAEHRIDETDAAEYEAHLVHTLPGDTKLRGPKLVVGVFVHADKKAPSKPTLKGLNEALRAEAADELVERLTRDHPATLDPTEFLPDEKKRANWFRYEGSLTTEPYSEDVSWYVMQAEVGVRGDEIDRIRPHALQHTRPVYALDRRFVLRSFR
jgi:carbonic anhydrase